MPLFKMFKNYWASINVNNNQTCKDIVIDNFNDSEFEEFHNELLKSVLRDDYFLLFSECLWGVLIQTN